MDAAIEVGIDPSVALALSGRVGGGWTPRGVECALGLGQVGAFTARAPDSTPVGIITCTRWDAFAWIGNMIVDPTAQRRGVGRALLQRALRDAEEHGISVLGLDATPQARALCAAEGFLARGESAIWTRERPREPPSVPSGEYAIYPVSAAEIMELHAYDRPRFGANRGRYLAALLAEEPHRSFVAVHRTSGAFSGLVLPAEGHVGPLVADTPEAAAWLLHAAENVGVQPRALVPSWNVAAETFFRRAGYTRGRTCTRMVRGGELPGRAETTFAIASWATG